MASSPAPGWDGRSLPDSSATTPGWDGSPRPDSSATTPDQRRRRALYKKGTPPSWREMHAERVQERLRAGRRRFLGRLRRVDGSGAPLGSGRQAALSQLDWRVAEWEHLQAEMDAEDEERYIQELGGADADPMTELCPRMVCPLCQTGAVDLIVAPTAVAPSVAGPAAVAPSAAARLRCHCGLDVVAPCGDLQQVQGALWRAVAAHEAVCAQPDLYFMQSAGQLLALCDGCFHQGPLW